MKNFEILKTDVSKYLQMLLFCKILRIVKFKLLNYEIFLIGNRVSILQRNNFIDHC